MPPLTVSDPISVIVPVCPAPEPRVSAVVDGVVMVKLAADAVDSAKKGEGGDGAGLNENVLHGEMVRKEMMGSVQENGINRRPDDDGRI